MGDYLCISHNMKGDAIIIQQTKIYVELHTKLVKIKNMFKIFHLNPWLSWQVVACLIM
jgi:hypothetical protein